MKWVPYPTKYKDDPRLDAAGEAAEILHNRAWAWCGDQERDGRIPKSMVARLCPVDTAGRVAALLEHELWEEAGDEYVLADWAGETGHMKGLEGIKEKNRLRQQRKRERDRAAAAGLSPAHPQDSQVSRDASRDGNAENRTPDQPPTGQRRTSTQPRRADQQVSPPSRDGSRDGHATVTPLEREEIYNPPNPPHGGGNDEPLNPNWSPGQCYRHRDRPSARCRQCGTTPRQLAAAAAAAAERQAAAELADLIQRRNELEWCGSEDCDPKFRKLKVRGGLVKCPHCHPDVVVGPVPVVRPTLTVVGGR